jgi:hypothetical protein
VKKWLRNKVSQLWHKILRLALMNEKKNILESDLILNGSEDGALHLVTTFFLNFVHNF